MAHFPIKNSEVYVLNPSSRILHPPPPSPPTPCEARSLSPVPSNDVLITPPSLVDHYNPTFTKRLSTAVHVLGTEATALSWLTRLYETDPVARGGFSQAVEAITKCIGGRGKLVLCGVGKSGHIAKKLVATMNSLRIPATFLHPTEALHGDLGKVGDRDVILLITFSGRTPELLSLIPHFSRKIQLLVITSHTHPSTCAIVSARPDTILLPAPIHESEALSFGVSAPTTSTTIALALGDALAVAVSNELHPSVSEVFLRNHPGGAIGQNIVAPKTLSCISVPLKDISQVDNAGKPAKAANIILKAYQSASGWVRLGEDAVVPPRRINKLQPKDMDVDAMNVCGLVIPSGDWFSLPGDLLVKEAIAKVLTARELGEAVCDDAVLATVLNGEVTGVVEVATLLANL